MTKANTVLRSRRDAAGKTQERVEAETGISQASLSSLERGHCPESVARAILLARSLGTTVEEIFGHLVTCGRKRRNRRTGERTFSANGGGEASAA
jgi:transcriptional regulator with XRE-family HTH domain